MDIKEYAEMFKEWNDFFEERSKKLKDIRVYMCHDPEWYGANIVSGYDGSRELRKYVRVSELFGFEPRDKLGDSGSRKKFDSLVSSIERGEEIEEILVRSMPSGGYQVIDGHHRYWAYQSVGVERIWVRIVPEDKILDVYTREELPKGIF